MKIIRYFIMFIWHLGRSVCANKPCIVIIAFLLTTAWVSAELYKLDSQNLHKFLYVDFLSAEFISITISGIGIFVSFLGILSIINTIEKVKEEVESLIKPTEGHTSKKSYIFILADRDDGIYAKKVRECLTTSLVGDMLKDCLKNIGNIEPAEIAAKLADCMDKVNIGYDEILPDSVSQTQISAGLKNCKIVIILFYNNKDQQWLEQRRNMVSGKKLILLTNEHILDGRYRSLDPFNQDGELCCLELVDVVKQHIKNVTLN